MNAQNIVTSGGFAALGENVEVFFYDGVDFLLQEFDNDIVESDLSRQGDVVRLKNIVPVYPANAPAAVLKSVWLGGSDGAVVYQIPGNPSRPIIGGNGNEVTVSGIEWNLPL